MHFLLLLPDFNEQSRDFPTDLLKRSIPEGDLHRLLLESRHLQRIQEHLPEQRRAAEEISDKQTGIAGRGHDARDEGKWQMQVD
jgi:hypothetical protein